MANSVNNTVVAKPLVTGGVLVAPVGTVLPTDEVTALDAAFLAVGYVTDSGVTKTEKRNTAVLYAWGNDTIAVTQKGYDVTVKLDLAEFLNSVVQSTIYGDTNVTVIAATSTTGKKLKIKGTSAPTPRNAWIFEIQSDVARIRVVIPDAKVMDIGDTVFNDGAIAAFPVTLQAFPDASGGYFYVYTDDGQVLAA